MTAQTSPANTKMIVEKIEKFWPISLTVVLVGNKDLVRVRLHAQFQRVTNL
jgi:tRNA A37 threonylcarbamoyladenosine synthetase subunit TsaC/SUA5/YrdC